MSYFLRLPRRDGPTDNFDRHRASCSWDDAFYGTVALIIDILAVLRSNAHRVCDIPSGNISFCNIRVDIRLQRAVFRVKAIETVSVDI